MKIEIIKTETWIEQLQESFTVSWSSAVKVWTLNFVWKHQFIEFKVL